MHTGIHCSVDEMAGIGADDSTLHNIGRREKPTYKFKADGISKAIYYVAMEKISNKELKYDEIGAFFCGLGIGSIFPKKTSEDNRYFCSELVTEVVIEAMERAGSDQSLPESERKIAKDCKEKFASINLCSTFLWSNVAQNTPK